MFNLKNNLEAALYYRSLGWSIFPVKVESITNGKANKKPLVIWGPYQNRIATDEEIKEWAEKFPNAGIGVATGKLSNIFVLDVDTGGDITNFNLPTTVQSQTGSGGWHYIFKYVEGIKNSSNQLGHRLDIRGEGGYIVLPPTHYSGNIHYKWINSPETTAIADAPKSLIKLLTTGKTMQNSPETMHFIPKAYEKETINEGEGRNNAAASYAGLLLGKTESHLWNDLCWPALKFWNIKHCKPPLTEKELRITFESIAKKEMSRGSNIDLGETIILEQNKIEEYLTPPISFKELCKKEFPKKKWVVDRLFIPGTINQISGAPNQWKSFITMHIAICIAKGLNVFNQFIVEQQGVMIVNEEDPERMLHDRILLLHEIEEDLPIYFHIEKGIMLQDEKISYLINEMKEKNLKVIIFDSLSMIHDANENDARDMNRIFKQMKKFTTEGFTVIFTNHHRKKSRFPGMKDDGQEQTRGSTVINAFPSCHVTCEEYEMDKNKYVIVNQVKLKGDEKLKPFLVKIQIEKELDITKKIQFIYDQEFEKVKKVTAATRAKDIILEQIRQNRDPISKQVLYAINKSEIGMNTIGEVIKELILDGFIEGRSMKELGMAPPDGSSSKTKVYSLKEDPPAELLIDKSFMGA